MSDPFAYQDPNAIGGPGLAGALGAIGAPGGGEITEGMLRQMQFDRLQAAPMEFQQQMEAYKAANPAPSKWATGAQTFGSIAQGLAGLGNIWLGLQSMKQQKKAFEFNKEVTNTNLNNSILDYNRRLGDVLQNRALNNGQGQGWISSELSKYSAKRSGG